MSELSIVSRSQVIPKTPTITLDNYKINLSNGNVTIKREFILSSIPSFVEIEQAGDCIAFTNSFQGQVYPYVSLLPKKVSQGSQVEILEWKESSSTFIKVYGKLEESKFILTFEKKNFRDNADSTLNLFIKGYF